MHDGPRARTPALQLRSCVDGACDSHAETGDPLVLLGAIIFFVLQSTGRFCLAQVWSIAHGRTLVRIMIRNHACPHTKGGPKNARANKPGCKDRHVRTRLWFKRTF